MSESLAHKDELKFYRLFYPRLIPRDLIEQIKNRTYTPEQFYAYQEEQCGDGVDGYNPNNFLYVLADSEKNIKGYFWAIINPMDRTLFLNTISIDKNHWGRGKIIPKVIDLVKKIVEGEKCSRTFWITENAKFYQKFGFKPSKHVLMEYEGLKLSKNIEDKFKKAYNLEKNR